MSALELKILICEDEGPAQKHITKLIKQINGSAQIVATVETGEEAAEVIANHDLDLIFMDIELADGPCFETLKNVEVNAPIIFTTAYDEYSLKAFKLKSIDYLVKPITKKDIEQAFEKFEEMRRMFQEGTQVYFQKNERSLESPIKNDLFEKLEIFLEDKFQAEKTIKRLFIKNGDTINIVQTSDIKWIEASGNYITIVTEEKKYLLRSTLKGIAEKLDEKKFFQIHKSTILNIDFITKIEEMAYGDYKIILKEGEELKMSRNYKDLIQSI